MAYRILGKDVSIVRFDLGAPFRLQTDKYLLMPNDSRTKVSEVIRSAMGDRIAQDTGKLCRDSKQRKNQQIDQYKMLGFKLNGVDGRVHGCDHAYYKEHANDIKDLQRSVGESLRAAGYDIDHVVLMPMEGDRHWSLSFTVTTDIETPALPQSRQQHSRCL